MKFKFSWASSYWLFEQGTCSSKEFDELWADQEVRNDWYLGPVVQLPRIKELIEAICCSGGEMSAKQTAQRFWVRVNKQGPDDCWEWQGAYDKTGYARVGWNNRYYLVHRISAWLSGLIPSPDKPKSAQDPTHVLHTCDNRKCCNPNHFFLGTYSDNQRDAYKKGRRRLPVGELNGSAKLTREQVNAIRKRYKQGEKQVELRKIYNMSLSAISKIIHNKTYRDVL